MPGNTITLGQAVGGFLAACGGLTTVAAAFVVVAKAIKAIKKPSEDANSAQNAKIAENAAEIQKLKKRMDALERKEEASNNELAKIDGLVRATLKGMLALLSNGIEGNSAEMKQQAYDELTQYLIEQ